MGFFTFVPIDYILKKQLIAIVSVIGVAIASSAFVIKTSTGKAGFAGNPGSPDCSFCHFNGSGVTTTSIISSPVFVSNQYIPNQTYTISVVVSSTTLNHFGYDCVVLNDTLPGAVNAGSISAIVGGDSQIINWGVVNNAVQINTTQGIIGSPSVQTFMFEWTAPSSGIAAFYASGLAVNNNGTYGVGDLGDNTSLILSDTSSTSVRDIAEVSIPLSVFPNPSSSAINIQYSLLSEGNVQVSLCNIQGKELAALFNEHQTFGKHTKTIFYPNSIREGIYMIKLTVNGKDVAEKMVIKQ